MAWPRTDLVIACAQFPVEGALGAVRVPGLIDGSARLAAPFYGKHTMTRVSLPNSLCVT